MTTTNSDKLDLIKIRKFCSVKDPGIKMKGQATDQAEIFENWVSNKELVSRIHKEHFNFNRKWTKDMN